MDRNFGGHSETHKRLDEAEERTDKLIGLAKEIHSHICKTA